MKLDISETTMTYEDGVSSSSLDLTIKGDREEVEWLLDRMSTASLARACEALERAAEAIAGDAL